MNPKGKGRGRKKLLTGLLLMALILTALPQAVFSAPAGPAAAQDAYRVNFDTEAVAAAAEPAVTITMRLEGQDRTIMPRVEISVPWFDLHDYFEFEDESNYPAFITPLHALIRLLEMGGHDVRDSAVLDVTGSAFGAYLNSILGVAGDSADSTYWMEILNDASGMGAGVDELREGDDLVLSLAHFDAAAAFFTAGEVKAMPGEAFTLTLRAGTYDTDFMPVTEAVAGATILISEKNGAAATQPTEWVTDQEGRVSLTLNETGSYVISAVRLSPGGDYIDITRPYCLVTVSAEALSDAESVAGAKAALRLGDLSAVVSDLSLPATGANGTAITWHSSDPAVIGHDGKVTRPSFAAGDATVQLTATISKGTASDTLVFTVTAPALPDPLLASAQTQLDQARKYYDVTRGKTLNDFWDL
ncbi:MAG: DUF4430 domain-containing protein, partial [Gracilibacteraceae bacterium]|nr:DUF4430 domain-containing protein [Gracilibacteraceae bacterium]